MNKKFIILSILLIISRGYDYITTILFTPDLKNETNIAVNIFNLNYIGVFIIQLCLLIFVIWCLHYYTNKKYNINKTNKNLTFSEFIPYFYFKSKQKYISFLYKKPAKNSTFYTIGYIVTMSLIYIGFIIGTSTTLLITSEYYNKLYKNGGPIVGYSLILLIVIIFTIKFYKKEYRRYKNLII